MSLPEPEVQAQYEAALIAAFAAEFAASCLACVRSAPLPSAFDRGELVQTAAQLKAACDRAELGQTSTPPGFSPSDARAAARNVIDAAESGQRELRRAAQRALHALSISAIRAT